MDAARHWALGGAVIDEVDEDCQAFGIDPDVFSARSGPQACGVLEENLPTVQAFLAVQTQLTSQGFRYEGVAAGLALAGIEASPELFAGLRVMERAACEAIAERRGG